MCHTFDLHKVHLAHPDNYWIKKGLKQAPGPCDIAGMGPTVRLLGPNLHKESCNEGPPPRAKIWAIWELDSPPELPTSYICLHSWSGWQRRGWPGRSTSCPKTLRSSLSFALTPLPSSTYPHRSPSSPLLPSLMYSLASRHATTESKLWPPGGEKEGRPNLPKLNNWLSGTCQMSHSFHDPPYLLFASCSISWG